MSFTSIALFNQELKNPPGYAVLIIQQLCVAPTYASHCSAISWEHSKQLTGMICALWNGCPYRRDT